MPTPRARPCIGVDVKTFALHGGGITAALRAVLPGVVDRLREIDWVAFGPSAALDSLPRRMRGVAVELVRGVGGVRLPIYDQWQLRRAACREGVSLLYSPYFDAPARLGVPTVVTMHDAVYLRFPELYPLTHRVYYRRLMQRHAEHAAAVITDSEFSRNELVSLLPVDGRRLHVVPIPVGEAFLRGPSRAGAHVTPFGSAPYALYTGGVEARKNLSRLFLAWARWARQRPDAPVLVLTGDPLRYRPFGAEIERLDLAGRIRFAGRLSEDHLVGVYGGASFVVYPSLYEGFGLPVAEAQAAGVPVACSNRASLPEVGGDAALYFDPESPEDMVRTFETLLTDHTLCRSLAARGRARAARFSPAASAEKLASILDAVLAQS